MTFQSSLKEKDKTNWQRFSRYLIVSLKGKRAKRQAADGKRAMESGDESTVGSSSREDEYCRRRKQEAELKLRLLEDTDTVSECSSITSSSFFQEHGNRNLGSKSGKGHSSKPGHELGGDCFSDIESVTYSNSFEESIEEDIDFGGSGEECEAYDVDYAFQRSVSLQQMGESEQEKQTVAPENDSCWKLFMPSVEGDDSAIIIDDSQMKSEDSICQILTKTVPVEEDECSCMTAIKTPDASDALTDMVAGKTEISHPGAAHVDRSTPLRLLGNDDLKRIAESVSLEIVPVVGEPVVGNKSPTQIAGSREDSCGMSDDVEGDGKTCTHNVGFPDFPVHVPPQVTWLQNVSSNKGSSSSDSVISGKQKSVHPSVLRRQSLLVRTLNRPLQRCIDKARLVTALTNSVEKAKTLIEKLATKAAYNKAIKEFIEAVDNLLIDGPSQWTERQPATVATVYSADDNLLQRKLPPNPIDALRTPVRQRLGSARRTPTDPDTTITPRNPAQTTCKKSLFANEDISKGTFSKLSKFNTFIVQSDRLKGLQVSTEDITWTKNDMRSKLPGSNAAKALKANVGFTNAVGADYQNSNTSISGDCLTFEIEKKQKAPCTDKGLDFLSNTKADDSCQKCDVGGALYDISENDGKTFNITKNPTDVNETQLSEDDSLDLVMSIGYNEDCPDSFQSLNDEVHAEIDQSADFVQQECFGHEAADASARIDLHLPSSVANKRESPKGNLEQNVPATEENIYPNSMSTDPETPLIVDKPNTISLTETAKSVHSMIKSEINKISKNVCDSWRDVSLQNMNQALSLKTSEQNIICNDNDNSPQKSQSFASSTSGECSVQLSDGNQEIVFDIHKSSARGTEMNASMEKKLECLHKEKLECIDEEQLDCLLEEKLGYVNEEQLECLHKEKLECIDEEQLDCLLEEKLGYVNEEQLECLHEEKLGCIDEVKLEHLDEEQLECLHEEKLGCIDEVKLEYLDEEQLECLHEEKLECIDEETLRFFGQEKMKCYDEEELEGLDEEKLEFMDEKTLECLDEEKLRCMDEEKLECLDVENLKYLDAEKLKCLDQEKLKCLDEEKLKCLDNQEDENSSQIYYPKEMMVREKSLDGESISAVIKCPVSDEVKDVFCDRQQETSLYKPVAPLENYVLCIQKVTSKCLVQLKETVAVFEGVERTFNDSKILKQVESLNLDSKKYFESHYLSSALTKELKDAPQSQKVATVCKSTNTPTEPGDEEEALVNHTVPDAIHGQPSNEVTEPAGNCVKDTIVDVKAMLVVMKDQISSTFEFLETMEQSFQGYLQGASKEREAILDSLCSLKTCVNQQETGIDQKISGMESTSHEATQEVLNEVRQCKSSISADVKKCTDSIAVDLKETVETSIQNVATIFQDQMNLVLQKLQESKFASSSKLQEDISTTSTKDTVDGLKMRLSEMRSQRDAEKMYHKITRESLRALERDHDRLRHEMLLAPIRRRHEERRLSFPQVLLNDTQHPSLVNNGQFTSTLQKTETPQMKGSLESQSSQKKLGKQDGKKNWLKDEN